MVTKSHRLIIFDATWAPRVVSHDKVGVTLRVISHIKGLILCLVRRCNHIASAWLLKAGEIIILASVIVVAIVTINCFVVATDCWIDCAHSVSAEPLEAHLTSMLFMVTVINLKECSQLGSPRWQLILTYHAHRHMPR